MRKLLIACDGPQCPETMETGTPDDLPVQIDAPGEWFTLHKVGHPDRHFCSLACLGGFALPSATQVSMTVTTPPPAATAPAPTKKGKS